MYQKQKKTSLNMKKFELYKLPEVMSSLAHDCLSKIRKAAICVQVVRSSDFVHNCHGITTFLSKMFCFQV